ncbi:MAG: hypothetical protein GXC76_15210 [Rhodanobacteraceae bacterium]|nr:hypothetical protein [Rhodanobacteraceae bacterium]
MLLLVALRAAGLTVRLGGALAVLAAFVVARGVGFAIYVGADTPMELLRQMGAAMGAGPC